MDIWSEIIAAAKLMSVWEILAVVFGVLSVWLSKKENILVYPTGIISVLLYVYICYEYGLYADVGINVFYFIMSIYGWYNWIQLRKSKVIINEDTIDEISHEVTITNNTTVQNIGCAGLVGVLWLILYFLLSKYTDSTVPYLDALTTAIGIVGMWLMALKKIENWIFWIVANIISVPLYFYKGLPLSSLQFLLFTGLAIAGFIEWNRKLKQS